MKLYDKQKTFDIKQLAKDVLIYHKPFYSNGYFIFNEKYLKVVNNLPGFGSMNRWRILSKVFYDTNLSDLHKIIAMFAPKGPDDDKLVSCCMEPMLKGRCNFKLIGQQFSYEIDGKERILYVNVDFLQYIDLKKCFFMTTAEPISPLIMYDINTSEFVGLIMPLT